MAKPNARSVRAKQNAVLRYIASTGLDNTADNFGLSPRTVRRFVEAKPQQILKDDEGFKTLLHSKPEQIAKRKNVHLVRKYTGTRQTRLYHREPQKLTEEQRRGLQFTKATKERRLVSGRYVPIENYEEQRRIHSAIIVQDLAEYNQASLDEMYSKGDIDQYEYDSVIAAWKRIYGKRK